MSDVPNYTENPKIMFGINTRNIIKTIPLLKMMNFAVTERKGARESEKN